MPVHSLTKDLEKASPNINNTWPQIATDCEEQRCIVTTLKKRCKEYEWIGNFIQIKRMPELYSNFYFQEAELTVLVFTMQRDETIGTTSNL